MAPGEDAVHARADDGIRWFSCAGEEWGARVSGQGVGGTGFLAIVAWEAVHFCRPDAPQTPVREALVARGRFPGLFDTELCDLLRASVAIVRPGERAAQ